MNTGTIQKIVLAEDAPLLHAMLKRILDKAENVEVVQELHKLDQPPDVLEGARPDWLVLSLSSGEDLPGWVDAYLAQHPNVGILVVAADRGSIRLKWCERHERQLDDPSLGELIHILKGHPQAARSSLEA
jgi:chemotaxis response regulator CheB